LGRSVPGHGRYTWGDRPGIAYQLPTNHPQHHTTSTDLDKPPVAPKIGVKQRLAHANQPFRIPIHPEFVLIAILDVVLE
jgi:hypothetical protein